MWCRCRGGFPSYWRGGNALRRVGFQRYDPLSNCRLISCLYMDRLHNTTDRRWHFNDGLVRLQFYDWLILRNRLTDRH
jgi:hypothetical protein